MGFSPSGGLGDVILSFSDLISVDLKRSDEGEHVSHIFHIPFHMFIFPICNGAYLYQWNNAIVGCLSVPPSGTITLLPSWGLYYTLHTLAGCIINVSQMYHSGQMYHSILQMYHKDGTLQI